MTGQSIAAISYVEADDTLRDLVVSQWKHYFPGVGAYICLEDGFTIAAMDRDKAVGLISIQFRSLTPPLSDLVEGYIYDIEVLPTHRRKGIATKLVEEATSKAAARGACQLRAWSSSDKTEPIPMWKALGFGLCPSFTTSAKTGEKIPGYFVTKPVG